MFNEIFAHNQMDIYPFHMPGHKKNKFFFPQNLIDFDITEIPGMDVLSSPSGIIKSFLERVSDFYGSKESFFLVNGSSSGIVAAICTICNKETHMIIPRNAHVSVFNGLILSGANPAYIMPEITPDGLFGGIDPKLFDDIPNNAVVLIVSPTYEGFVSDIKLIAKKVHSKEGILIVDEAHGAHFAFNKYFPLTAIECGADIVINSLHKTLPAMGQTALLHVNSTKIDVNRLRFFINAVQTSSPSYILMSQCDFMLKKLWDLPEIFEDYISELKSFDDNRKRVGESAIFDVDSSKILFTLTSNEAENISNIMANEYKIQMEMASGQHILAMTSPADTKEGFKRLKNAIDSLGLSANYCSEIASNEKLFLPEVVMPLCEVIKMDSELVSLNESAGRISWEIISRYPPGVALVAPGERIPKNLSVNSSFIRVIK